MAENKELFHDLLDAFPEDRVLNYLHDMQVIQDSLHLIQNNISLLKENPAEFETVHGELTKRFDELVASFEEDALEAGVFHRVAIYSAEPLSETMREKILAQVEERWGTKYLVDYHVDPSLLGGIRLEVDEAVFDTTYRSRLDQLAREV